MVILAIHSGSQLGGSTLNLGFVVRSVAARGHRVHVLNRHAEDEGSRYLRRCGADLSFFSRFSIRMNTTTILESSTPSLGTELVKSVQDVVKAIVGFWLAASLIRTHRPDIVFLTESALPQCIVAAKLLRVPIVCELQAEMIVGRLGLRRWLYTRLVRGCERSFGISRFHITPLTEPSGLGERVSIIPNTVDPRDLEPMSAGGIRAAYLIPTGSKIVAFFGGTSAIKGCRFLMTVVDRILAARDDVVFVVAGPFHRDFSTEWAAGTTKGDREESAHLFQRLGTSRSAKNIRIVGEVVNAVAIIGESDVVVAPNAFPHFSRTVLEAFYQSVPVVASDDKFSRDVIEDGRSGMLANYGDSQTWVEKISRILDAPELARAMGSAGRKVFESRFTAELVSGRIVGVFEGLHCERGRTG